jgi:hypothetical protein
MSDSDFQNYRNGRSYRAIGGWYDRFPVRITVPSSGRWNTVLDLGGRQANIRAGISYVKQP